MAPLGGLVVVIVALVLVAPAYAKPDPVVTSLKKQVAALRADVADLKRSVDQNHQLAICYYALGQDSFRVVFSAMSMFSEAITGKRVSAWDAIQRFDDQGACASVGIPRP